MNNIPVVVSSLYVRRSHSNAFRNPYLVYCPLLNPVLQIRDTGSGAFFDLWIRNGKKIQIRNPISTSQTIFLRA
jgi:hypothetical protein